MKDWKNTWEWLRSILLAVILALLIRFFLFEVFVVEGSSMYPTLHESERLMINKMAYNLGQPSRGDIVVFEVEPGRDFVKRVIGIEGDRIVINNGRVYLNGTILEEPYLADDMGPYNYGPKDVPSGHLFLMGDYRDNSLDSRDPRVGFISAETLKGRAVFIFWPPWEARRIAD